MALRKGTRSLIFISIFLIYFLTGINFQVYCKGAQSPKSADSGKSDDFSEFDQEDENDAVEDDSDFGYVTTPDQEQGSSQGLLHFSINFNQLFCAHRNQLLYCTTNLSFLYDPSFVKMI